MKQKFVVESKIPYLQTTVSNYECVLTDNKNYLQRYNKHIMQLIIQKPSIGIILHLVYTLVFSKLLVYLSSKDVA